MRHGVEALFPLRWFDARLAVYSVSVLSVTRPGVPNVYHQVKKCCQEGCFCPWEKKHNSVKKNALGLVD